MKEKFREHFRLLKEAPPGERFQHYHRHKREGHPVKMILKIVAGLICFMIAMVLTVTPGPAFVFYILGFALISAQSRTLAKWLDAAEVTIRKSFKKKSSKD